MQAMGMELEAISWKLDSDSEVRGCSMDAEAVTTRSRRVARRGCRRWVFVRAITATFPCVFFLFLLPPFLRETAGFLNEDVSSRSAAQSH
jgi:hypothetical protein